MMDHAPRGEQAAIPGPAQSECQVDILVIRSEKRIETANLVQRSRSVESARAAGAEDLFGDRAANSSRGWP